jgi:DNA-binding transcriptional LysR family regulator
MAGRKKGPTVDQVRAFCVVAEVGSYRRAAARLGINDQHVSLIRRVERLGNSLGRGRLIAADSRGNTSLTSAGRDLLPAAQRFLAAAEQLATTQVVVRLSTYPSIAAQLIAERPDLFDGNFPLELHEVSEDARQGRGRRLVRDVDAGTLDLAVAPSGLGTRGVEEHLLYSWRLRAILPRADERAYRDTVTPLELSEFQIAAAPTGHTSRDQLEAAYNSENVPLRISLESSSQELLHVLATKSAVFAAVVPDDAYGAPNPDLGPCVVTQSKHAWGGDYSLYVRRGVLEPSGTDAANANLSRVVDAVFASIRRTRP